MARLVTKNGHAFRPGAALGLKHHLLLELHQAGMGKIERDGDAWHTSGAEPFARDPCMRPNPNTAILELFIQGIDTVLEPRVFDRHSQATEALLEQLLIRQLVPGMLLSRHKIHDGKGHCLDRVIGARSQQPPRLSG